MMNLKKLIKNHECCYFGDLINIYSLIHANVNVNLIAKKVIQIKYGTTINVGVSAKFFKKYSCE